MPVFEFCWKCLCSIWDAFATILKLVRWKPLNYQPVILFRGEARRQRVSREYLVLLPTVKRRFRENVPIDVHIFLHGGIIPEADLTTIFIPFVQVPSP